MMQYLIMYISIIVLLTAAIHVQPAPAPESQSSDSSSSADSCSSDTDCPKGQRCSPPETGDKDDKTCTSPSDECKPNPCQNGGECYVNGAVRCDCLPGFCGDTCDTGCPIP